MSEKSKKHGGARRGAGRKVSEARKATLRAAEEARARTAAALGSAETPLDYMLRVMRDATVDDKRRDAMATAAAQYLHPKLAAVEHSGNQEKPLTMLHEIVGELDGMGRGLPHSSGIDPHATH